MFGTDKYNTLCHTALSKAITTAFSYTIELSSEYLLGTHIEY